MGDGQSWRKFYPVTVGELQAMLFGVSAASFLFFVAGGCAVVYFTLPGLPNQMFAVMFWLSLVGAGVMLWAAISTFSLIKHETTFEGDEASRDPERSP